jgi:hypothetical protein
MQDSYSELIKLLPEIIVEYFELTSYKKEMNSPPLKEVNSFSKNRNLIKFLFFDEITVQDFQLWTSGISAHHCRRWLNEDNGQVVLEIEFSSRRNSATQEFAFFKEINRFHPNDCNAIASFLGYLKNYKINTRIFCDFKIWNQNHTQRLAYLPGQKFIDR